MAECDSQAGPVLAKAGSRTGKRKKRVFLEVTSKMAEFRPRCPTCEMLVDVQMAEKFLPFCSQRCRFVDLGRWLNEEHRLTCEEEEEEESPPTAGGGVVLPPGWHDA